MIVTSNPQGLLRGLVLNRGGKPRITLLVVGALLVLWLLSSPLLHYYDSLAVASLSSDIEERTYAQFDSLVQQGQILYQETQADLYVHRGFTFDFRIAPILKEKPVLSPDDPGRTSPGGPFSSPSSDEIISNVGHSHRLLLNKYSLFRPSLVLTTKHFAQQADDLDASDLSSAWAVLSAFRQHKLIAVYNCGVNSGASQGHKHLQFFPHPGHALWPEMAESTTDLSTQIANVPFKHFVLRLPANPSVRTLVATYARLMAVTRTALTIAGEWTERKSRDYNVILTTEYMALVPRIQAGSKAPFAGTRGSDFGIDGLGMLGIVGVRDQEERKEWDRLKYTAYLRWLGMGVEEWHQG